MKLFEQIPLTFEGNDYKIHVMYDKKIVNTAAFLNNRPANGFRYQIQIPKHIDAEIFLKGFSTDSLVEKCKSDIVEKRWDEISKITN